MGVGLRAHANRNRCTRDLFATGFKRTDRRTTVTSSITFRSMSSPALEYHEEESLGKAYDSRLMRRLLRYVRPYGWLVAVSLSLLALEGLLQLVGPLLTQRVIDWRLAVASFAVIPFVWLTSSLFQKSVRAAYRDIRTRLARINAYLQEHITGMRIVQLFGRERDEAHRFDALNEDHLRAHLKSIRFYALYFPAIEVLTTVALASLIVAGERRVEVDALTVGTVAAFLQLV